MPDHAQIQFDETKAGRYTLAASKRLYELCRDLTKDGKGFNILFQGKGDAPITVSVTIFEGPVMYEGPVM